MNRYLGLALATMLAGVLLHCSSSSSPADAGAGADQSSPAEAGGLDAGGDRSAQDSGVDATTDATADAAADATSMDSSPQPDGAMAGGDGSAEAGTDTGSPQDSGGSDAPLPGQTPVTFVDISNQSYLADQAVTLTVPDGYAVTGTVSVASLPSGASVQSVLVTAYESNELFAFTAQVSAVTASSTSFTYQMNMPAGTYSVIYQFVLTFGSGQAGVLYQNAFDTLTVSGDEVHDVSLPALTVVNVSAAISGFSALDPPIFASGYLAEIWLESADKTVVALGTAPPGSFSGDVATVSVTVPSGTYDAKLVPFDVGDVNYATRRGGSLSYMLVKNVSVTGNFSVALPPFVKLAGAISDPGGRLADFPGPSCCGIVQHIDSVPNTFTGMTPSPPWILPEIGSGEFYVPSETYHQYIPTGETRFVSPTYYVGLASDTLLQGRENGDGSLTVPADAQSASYTFSSNMTLNWTVPSSIGSIVTLSGLVEDARHHPLPGYAVTAHSDSLQGVTSATHEASVVADANGTFTLHVLAGTFDLRVSEPATVVVPAGTDAGTGTEGGTDAGGDSGAAADAGSSCAALLVCCNAASYPSAQKAGCILTAQSGVQTNCAGSLTGAELLGYCP